MNVVVMFLYQTPKVWILTIPLVGGRSFICSAHAYCFSVLATLFAFRLNTSSDLYSQIVTLPMKWGAAVGEAARARNWDASGVSYSQRVYGDTYKKQKTNPPGNDGWDAWN